MATWQPGDLFTVVESQPVPAAAGNPFAYGVPECDPSPPMQLDTSGCPVNIVRVVYRGVDKNIHELSLNVWGGAWQCNNLFSAARPYVPSTEPKGAPPAAYHDPTAFVGSPMTDTHGTARVSYSNELGQIYQLALGDSGWIYGAIWNNDGLHPAVPAAVPAGGPAFGYWDPNNTVDRVVYLGSPKANQIYELSDQNNQTWVCSNLSTSDKSDPAQLAAGNPFGYCFAGVPQVIYRGTDGHIYELHLEAAGWKLGDLSLIAEHTAPVVLAAGDPCGYEANDGIPRVIYRGTNNHICELALH
jgi:hypothetical protein